MWNLIKKKNNVKMTLIFTSIFGCDNKVLANVNEKWLIATNKGVILKCKKYNFIKYSYLLNYIKF